MHSDRLLKLMWLNIKTEYYRMQQMEIEIQDLNITLDELRKENFLNATVGTVLGDYLSWEKEPQTWTKKKERLFKNVDQKLDNTLIY